MIRARAPGKLFLTGAWAVLEGAPAIVVAIDRFAEASIEGEPSTMPEVIAVARRLEANVPHVDVSAMQKDARKIGVGSSAAAAVAAAGVILAARDLRAEGAKRDAPLDLETIVDAAVRAHREVQPRGSGADVAACAHGGVVEVRRVGDRLEVTKRSLPAGLVVRTFVLGRSSSTRDALDRFVARRADAKVDYAIASMSDAATIGARAVADDDLDAFLSAAAAHVRALEHLGAALDLPLVPFEVAMARDLLESSSGASNDAKTAEMQAPNVLLPSGAGGGDTVVWLGARAPTDQEAAALERGGLRPLDVSLSTRGVHLVDADRNR